MREEEEEEGTGKEGSPQPPQFSSSEAVSTHSYLDAHLERERKNLSSRAASRWGEV